MSFEIKQAKPCLRIQSELLLDNLELAYKWPMMQEPPRSIGNLHVQELVVRTANLQETVEHSMTQIISVTKRAIIVGLGVKG
jgi:hypothetical protein